MKSEPKIFTLDQEANHITEIVMQANHAQEARPIAVGAAAPDGYEK